MERCANGCRSSGCLRPLQADLDEAGIARTTIRMAIGGEEPLDLTQHLVEAVRLTFDPAVPGVSAGFPSRAETVQLIRETWLDVQRRYIEAKTAD